MTSNWVPAMCGMFELIFQLYPRIKRIWPNKVLNSPICFAYQFLLGWIRFCTRVIFKDVAKQKLSMNSVSKNYLHMLVRSKKKTMVKQMVSSHHNKWYAKKMHAVILCFSIDNLLMGMIWICILFCVYYVNIVWRNFILSVKPKLNRNIWNCMRF